MADKKGIAKLDEKLVSDGIIPEQILADLPLVHRKMNSILKKTGAILSDEIFETGNEALRKWLQTLNKKGASQEKLTAYLRCGLAHLTYDYVESRYQQIGIDDLVARTLVSLKKRKQHAAFFKPAQETAKPAPAKKTTAVKKATPIKKSGAPVKESAKPSAKAKAPVKPAKAKAPAKTAKTKPEKDAKTSGKKPSAAKPKAKTAKPATAKASKTIKPKIKAVPKVAKASKAVPKKTKPAPAAKAKAKKKPTA